MPDIILSDVHLRLDKPDRGARLAGLVDTLTSHDRLMIVGDLCDFWFATRQRHANPRDCPGLSALLRFRERNGQLRIMLGNHDTWLGPAYGRWFGVDIDPEPCQIRSHGLSITLAHGHRAPGRSWWKGVMETRAFFRGFELLPPFVARPCEALLDRVNERRRERNELRMIAEYRRLIRTQPMRSDLAVFGHVHRVLDEQIEHTRLIVLGDWLESTRYLRIDDQGVSHVDIPEG